MASRSGILGAVVLLSVGCAGPPHADADDGEVGEGSGEGGSEGVAGRASAGAGGGSATSTSASTTGPGSGSGGGPPSCAGDPMVANPGEWTWFKFPDTHCASGTPAGVAINTSTASDALLVFMMGGGACFTQAECTTSCDQQTQHCAANLDGYDVSKAAQELGQFEPGSMFDRSSPTNPFKDWSYVFVPYCTGDFHSGGTTTSYGIQHQGFANMSAYLARIVPTFCTASRVLLTGSSAGGWGTIFNYHQVKDAFGTTRVDLVDDSGPPLSTASMGLQAQMMQTWGSAANAPPGCAECQSTWAAYLPFYAAEHPGSRFSVISSLEDYVIGPYFAGPIQFPEGYRAAMNDFADSVVGPMSNARVFYVDEFHHVYLGGTLAKASMGVALGGFLAQQIADDPGWASVRP